MNVRFQINQEGNLGSPPIIMIHGDESNRLIPKYLDDRIPFIVFKHMGNENRKFPLNTIQEIAALYNKKLNEIYPNGPFILTGYSIGGVIAFEMAQQLFKKHKRVAELVLLDSKAPGLQSDFEYHNRQIKWNEGIFSKAYKRVTKKSMLAFFRYSGINLPKKQFYFLRMQKYRKARKNYSPKTYDGDLHIIKSEKYNFKDPNLGWKKHISGDISFSSIHCDHHSIVIEPNIQTVTNAYEEIYWSRFK